MPPEEQAWVGHDDNTDEDNFSRPGNLYHLFDEGECDRLIGTMAQDLAEVDGSVRERIIAQCHAADRDYDERVEKRLKALPER